MLNSGILNKCPICNKNMGKTAFVLNGVFVCLDCKSDPINADFQGRTSVRNSDQKVNEDHMIMDLITVVDGQRQQIEACMEAIGSITLSLNAIIDVLNSEFDLTDIEKKSLGI